MNVPEELTEFEDVTVDEVHLVTSPASRFAPLMAKSAFEKGKPMKKSVAKALVGAGAVSKEAAASLVEGALKRLGKEASNAAAAGETNLFRDLMKQRLLMKFAIRDHQRGQSAEALWRAQRGIGTPLFEQKVRTHGLPDRDSDIEYR